MADYKDIALLGYLPMQDPDVVCEVQGTGFSSSIVIGAPNSPNGIDKKPTFIELARESQGQFWSFDFCWALPVVRAKATGWIMLKSAVFLLMTPWTSVQRGQLRSVHCHLSPTTGPSVPFSLSSNCFLAFGRTLWRQRTCDEDWHFAKPWASNTHPFDLFWLERGNQCLTKIWNYPIVQAVCNQSANSLKSASSLQKSIILIAMRRS